MVYALILLFILGLSGGVVVYQWLFDLNPRNLYREVFGAAPSATVQRLRGAVRASLGYEEVLLQFQADTETVAALTRRAYRPLQSVERQTFQFTNQSSHPPHWWKFAPSPQMQVWVPHRQKGNFVTAEAEFLAFDPATNWTYYHYLGVT